MKKNCMKCGKEYILTQFSLDSGYCDDCKPGFFSLPELRESTPAETKSLLYSMICLNGILAFLNSFLYEAGQFGVFLFGGMAIFWTCELVRYFFSKKGFPALTIFQRLMILSSPFYAVPVFIIIWRLMRTFIFEESC